MHKSTASELVMLEQLNLTWETPQLIYFIKSEWESSTEIPPSLCTAKPEHGYPKPLSPWVWLLLRGLSEPSKHATSHLSSSLEAHNMKVQCLWAEYT